MSDTTLVNILSVANAMLKESAFSLTNLKLQKLLYYVYGVNLVTNEAVSISEPPQAWNYGPVFPTVYTAVKHYGINTIAKKISLPRKQIPNLDDTSLNDIVWAVYKKYGGLQEFELVARTHASGTPWEKVYMEDKRNITIPDIAIKKYFKENIIDEHGK